MAGFNELGNADTRVAVGAVLWSQCGPYVTHKQEYRLHSASWAERSCLQQAVMLAHT